MAARFRSPSKSLINTHPFYPPEMSAQKGRLAVACVDLVGSGRAREAGHEPFPTTSGSLLDGVEPAAAARAWEELRTRLVAHELVAHELVAHETGDGVFCGSSGGLITARLAS